jgi:hypothetical protein
MICYIHTYIHTNINTHTYIQTYMLPSCNSTKQVRRIDYQQLLFRVGVMNSKFLRNGIWVSKSLRCQLLHAPPIGCQHFLHPLPPSGIHNVTHINITDEEDFLDYKYYYVTLAASNKMGSTSYTTKFSSMHVLILMRTYSTSLPHRNLHIFHFTSPFFYLVSDVLKIFFP